MALVGSASRNMSSATLAFALSFLRPLVSIGEDESCEVVSMRLELLLLGAGCIDHFMERSSDLRLESLSGRAD